MKLKPNYFVIPLVTLATSYLGSTVTSGGMEWYQTIVKPEWTPSGAIIGTVWTVLFILATISALLFWNRETSPKKKKTVVTVFLLNAALNFLWSYIFFGAHLIDVAVWEAGLLALSVLALIVLMWRKHKVASLLLLPYLLWVSFATYLTYSISLLN